MNEKEEKNNFRNQPFSSVINCSFVKLVRPSCTRPRKDILKFESLYIICSLVSSGCMTFIGPISSVKQKDEDVFFGVTNHYLNYVENDHLDYRMEIQMAVLLH